MFLFRDGFWQSSIKHKRKFFATTPDNRKLFPGQWRHHTMGPLHSKAAILDRFIEEYSTVGRHRRMYTLSTLQDYGIRSLLFNP
jgi:hypothetical protein